MENTRREPLRSRNTAFDPYRDQIAELSIAGQPEGFLAVYAETVWSSRRGHLWWKRVGGRR
jgi:hypothetical protein